MDPTLAPLYQPGTLDAYTHKPFIADANWYSTAKQKYNPIYIYKATDDGITINKIETHQTKVLPYPRGFKPTQPNGITVYFPDTSGQGLSPYGSTTEHIVFNMNPTTQTPQLMELLSVTRSDSPNLVPLLAETDDAQPIWPGTPEKTALSHPLLRELLLIMAIRSFVMQGFRLAPGAQDLVKHIALAGPPVVPHGARVSYDELGFASEFHRRWVWTDEGMRWDFVPKGLRLRRDVEAALVRNGWRDPGRGLQHLEPIKDKRDAQEGGDGDEDGMCDMVDALLHVGYLDNEEKRADVLVKVARYGALGEVKFAVGKIERGSIMRAHECEILPAAAAGGKGRAEVLAFLLDSGLDPNAVSGERKNKLALHMAIRHGDVDMVKVLLDAGAKMVKDDEWGLPIEAAEGLEDKEDRAAKVAVIDQWLEERGLPRNHVDLAVFVDESVSDLKTRSWGSQTGCCKTCGTRSGL